MRSNKSVTSSAANLLRIEDAADMLALKPATLRAWLLRRKLPCVRLSARAVRVRREDVEEIISKGFVGAR